MEQSEVISELKKIELNDTNKRYFLAGVVKCVGNLSIEDKRTSLEMEFAESEDGVKVARYVGEELGVFVELTREKQERSKTKFKYVLKLREPFSLELLSRIGVMTYENDSLVEYCTGLPRLLNEEGAKAYFRALFLCKGRLFAMAAADETNGGESGYRLELSSVDKSFAEDVINWFNRPEYAMLEIDIKFRYAERKGSGLLYLGDATSISDFLAYIGAVSAVLELQNLILERSFRNNVNRRKNCDYANVTKSVEAASRQVEAIMLLEANGTLSTLDDKLQAVAKIRIDNPDMTVEEIALELNISKSGAYHRLNKLIELAHTSDK